MLGLCFLESASEGVIDHGLHYGLQPAAEPGVVGCVVSTADAGWVVWGAGSLKCLDGQAELELIQWDKFSSYTVQWHWHLQAQGLRGR